MQKQKNRLEVTTLSWEYKDKWQNGFRQGSGHRDKPSRLNVDGTPKREYFFKLQEHDCDYGENECGIYISGVAIHVGSDGNGQCEILHPDYTRSGGEHEIQLLDQHLQRLFKNGEKLHVGGCGVTRIDFTKRSGEPLTDIAMDIYKKLITVFFDEGEDIGRYVVGPRIVRRSYLWSTDLKGWIAFEDRLACRHGLRPINETKSQYDKKPFELFWWP